MSTMPLLLLDFDGVVNFDTTLSAHKRLEGTPHYRRKTVLYAGGYGYQINYSGEVLYRLNHLKREAPYEWLWLSTWRRDSWQFKAELGADDDGYVPWRETDGQGMPGYMVDARHAAKLAHVLHMNAENPRPFVWVDDEATVNFRSDLLEHDVPHLVIAPDPSYGLVRSELEVIEGFMRTHA